MSALASRLVVRTAWPEDIFPIAENMRDQDRDEVMASTGLDPYAALATSFYASDTRWTVVFNSIPIAMFGVSSMSMLSDIGRPWMLGTHEMLRFPRTIVRRSKQYIREMQSRYRVLTNLVDSRNLVSIKWLEWCGFEVRRDIVHTLGGHEFYQFEMTRVK